MQQNLNPHIWGSHAWFFIESLIYSYPEKPNNEIKLKFKQFLDNLILPCSICTHHYKTFLIENNLDNALHSRTLLMKWILDLHNNVNYHTNKQKLTTNEFYNYYNSKYSNKCDFKCLKINTNNEYYYFLFIVSIILLYKFL